MSRPVTTPLLLSLLAALLAFAGPAEAAKKKPRKLWATVNVCDTADHPDTIGIRASMPGTGRKRERMFMRFQVQFLKASDGKWHGIGPGGDSGFVRVGSARYDRREAGRNFTLEPPQAGQEFLVRGVVTFEWRRGATIVRRERQRTRTIKRTTTGADPKGFSAAACTIRN